MRIAKDGRKTRRVAHGVIDQEFGQEHRWGLQDRLRFDITIRKKTEESLARQAEDLARSNLELDRFAYVASHDLPGADANGSELRSTAPATTVRTCVTGDAAEYLGFIVGGVQRMQTLINDLLAYSRVGSQGGAFARADCKAICAKIMDNLHASIVARSIRPA